MKTLLSIIIISLSWNGHLSTQNVTTSTTDCDQKFEVFLQTNMERKVTLSTACSLCKIPQTECHCLKQPLLCNNVKSYNTQHWKTCQARFTRVILNFLFGFLGILGNALVVIVTIRNRHTSSRCHKLIGGLAGSDLVFSVSQTVRYTTLFWTCQWKLGQRLCIMFPLVKDLSSYLSIGFILIVATERFSLIVCPHRKPLSNVAIAMMCFSNVILGIGICIPKVMSMRFDHLTGQCYDSWNDPTFRLSYDYTLLIAYFALPLLIIIYEHAQIVRRLRHQEQTIHKAKMADRNLRRNKRIARILIAIVVGYIVLISPKRVICLLKAYYGSQFSKSESLSTGLRLASCLPYGFHVALNPIVYSFFDRRFRKSVRAMFPLGYGGPSRNNKNVVTNSTESTSTS